MSTYLSSSFINVIPAEAGIQLTAVEENRCSKHATNQHHLLNLKLLVIEQQLCPQSSQATNTTSSSVIGRKVDDSLR